MERNALSIVIYSAKKNDVISPELVLVKKVTKEYLLTKDYKEYKHLMIVMQRQVVDRLLMESLPR